jgi:hypothetical protein
LLALSRHAALGSFDRRLHPFCVSAQAPESDRNLVLIGYRGNRERVPVQEEDVRNLDPRSLPGRTARTPRILSFMALPLY